ncbi:hypothetical protein [Roseisolibacter agri]|nr:hypothetical protein [Roseisolibacter agri]
MPILSTARALRTMLRRPSSLAGLALVALSGLAACADAPSAPRPVATDAPSRGLLGGVTGVVGGVVGGVVSTVEAILTPVTGMLWSSPVTAVTVSGVIGAQGGSIAIPNGARLIVPAGAVGGPVAFSISRVPGRIVAYEFQPHGIRFAVPVVIEQPLAGINLSGISTSSIEGAYFADVTALDQTKGSAQVSEFRPTVVLKDRGVVRFTVDHFSGYMVSSGRSEIQDDSGF